MPTRDNKNLLLFPFYPHVLSGQNFRRKNPVFQIPVRCFIPLIDNDPKKTEHHKIHESPNWFLIPPFASPQDPLRITSVEVFELLSLR